MNENEISLLARSLVCSKLGSRGTAGLNSLLEGDAFTLKPPTVFGFFVLRFALVHDDNGPVVHQGNNGNTLTQLLGSSDGISDPNMGSRRRHWPQQFSLRNWVSKQAEDLECQCSIWSGSHSSESRSIMKFILYQLQVDVRSSAVSEDGFRVGQIEWHQKHAWKFQEFACKSVLLHRQLFWVAYVEHNQQIHHLRFIEMQNHDLLFKFIFFSVVFVYAPLSSQTVAWNLDDGSRLIFFYFFSN